MAEIIIAKHRSGAATDVKLRFLKEQTRFMDLDMDEFSTAGDPMGGGYTQIASSMGGLGDDEFALPVAGGASAPMGGLGAPMGGGLGSSMGGNEFDIQQGPTNMDKQRPLTDEVPF
jgi:hypothetical protein